jgi:membrane peptidoglycan carboxypeptidase
VHRADGTSLLETDGTTASADNFPSFTLGSVNVSPLTMAAAYATVAARGTYCAPVAITKIITEIGGTISAPSADCHQAISPDIADAVNYILQGVLTAPGATGAGLSIGRPAAAKTGTSNVASTNLTGANGTPYAAFAGYTPSLVSYTSVFNPADPTKNTMGGIDSCYHGSGGGQLCPLGGEMFGANAPGQTWQMTFEHANLGGVSNFVSVAADSPLNSMGNGQNVSQKGGGGKGKGKNGGGGKGNGNGNGNCVFFFCTGNGGGGGGGNNGGGGGGANGGPINAGNATTKALITGNLARPIAREE